MCLFIDMFASYEQIGMRILKLKKKISTKVQNQNLFNFLFPVIISSYVSLFSNQISYSFLKNHVFQEIKSNRIYRVIKWNKAQFGLFHKSFFFRFLLNYLWNEINEISDRIRKVNARYATKDDSVDKHNFCKRKIRHYVWSNYRMITAQKYQINQSRYCIFV